MEKKKRKLIIEFATIFSIGLIIFLASILTWFIYLRPFKEFKKFEMPLLIGENVIFNNERTEAIIYYEIEGIKFEVMVTASGSLNNMGNLMKLYYQADDPTYQVGGRQGFLWALPFVAVFGGVMMFFAFKNNKAKQKK